MEDWRSRDCACSSGGGGGGVLDKGCVNVRVCVCVSFSVRVCVRFRVAANSVDGASAVGHCGADAWEGDRDRELENGTEI